MALLNLNIQAQDRDFLTQNAKKAFDRLNSNDATDITYLGYTTPSNQIVSGSDTIILKQLRTNGQCYVGFNGAEFIVTNGATGVTTYKQEITDFGCQAGRVGSVATSSTVPVSTITWKCLGDNGGSSVNCSAKVVEPINGQCSSTYHNVTKIVSDGATGVTSWFNTISSTGCTTGTVYGTAKSANSPPTTITWQCLGVYGGTNTNCSSFVVEPINGQCNSTYNGKTYTVSNGLSATSIKDSILGSTNSACNRGILRNWWFYNLNAPLPTITKYINYRQTSINWNCEGVYGGNNENCSTIINAYPTSCIVWGFLGGWLFSLYKFNYNWN